MVATSSLIFVYNADSGGLNTLKDSLNKLISPQTYNCNLCALTHSAIGEKRAWKKFRNQFPIAMEFYHKDEFERAYKSKWLPKYEYPLTLLASESGLELFLSSEEFKAFANLKDLTSALNKKAAVFKLN